MSTDSELREMCEHVFAWHQEHTKVAKVARALLERLSQPTEEDEVRRCAAALNDMDWVNYTRCYFNMDPTWEPPQDMIDLVKLTHSTDAEVARQAIKEVHQMMTAPKRLSQAEDPRIAEIEKRHQIDQSLCVTSFDELLALARERHSDRSTLLSIVRGKA